MCVPTNGQLYVVFCKVLSAPHDRGEKHSKKSHHYVYYNIYILNMCVYIHFTPDQKRLKVIQMVS